MSNNTDNISLERKRIIINFYGKEIFISPKSIFILVLVPIIPSLLANYLTNKFFTTPSVELSTYEENINDVNNEIKNLSDNIEEFNASLLALDERLKILEDKNSFDTTTPNSPIHIDGDNNTINFSKLIPTDIGMIKTDYKSFEMACLLSQPTWESNDIIAIDSITNLQICAEDIKNEKIILPFKNGNQETYFYGQFDEENRWDGECVINIYENDNLSLIMEAEYNHGILLSYKQVTKYTTKAGVNVWNISKRINEEEYHKGINKYYFRGDKEYSKIFDINNVKEEEILNIKSFENDLKNTSWLEGYYYGNTSNGNFNDNTNNACMIKYFEDGTIRTLYVGNFKDGDFYDNSNKAWYITKNYNTTYMYYKGIFIDGEPTHNKGHIFENFISYERIEEILHQNHCLVNENYFLVILMWSKN